MAINYFKNLYRINKDKRKLIRKFSIDTRTILESGFFDENWYYDRNPEAALYPGGAVAHYYRYALIEQMSAGPKFDTKAYLVANPDVLASGINPLIHYVRHGLHEGRGFASLRNIDSDRNSHRKGNTKTKVDFSVIVKPNKSPLLRLTLDNIIDYPSKYLEIVGSVNEVVMKDLPEPFGPNGISVITLEKTTEENFLRQAITAANNEFIIILEPGDSLTPEALYEFARFINSHDYDIVYGDERQHRLGSVESFSVLKPDWSPELLLSFNYFGRPTAIRRSIALAALPSASSGEASEWDMHLRASSYTNKIGHLPLIVCDRADKYNNDARLPAGEGNDHIKVIKDYWRRRGRDAEISRASDGTFHSTWSLDNIPLVSIIIPNKDKAELLRVCVEGLLRKTKYPKMEIIIVDNDSTDTDTLKLYDDIRGSNVKFVAFNQDFNYSRACNMGADVATGEFLLFLNNDIEVIDPEWLSKLVQMASEPGVGIVGAKLLYPDGEIQHAGVALGLFTLAAHVFHRSPPTLWGPFGTPQTTRNWTAVTGACQLMRRTVYDLVGGYDESFQISYSDIVLCLYAVRAGFRTVYASNAVLVHHEGASRGLNNPTNDQIVFARRLRELGIGRDPFFHPLLDTQSFEPRLGKKTKIYGHESPIESDVRQLAGPMKLPLDLFDDGAVANASNLSWDSVIWPFNPRELPPGATGGIRILLEFIRRRRDLHKKFPDALSAGVIGDFAAWTRSEGLRLLDLAPDKASWIDAAFLSDPGAAPRHHLFFDQDLRASHPLFLLPEGRDATCKSLFAGYNRGQLKLEEIWWFLIQNAESTLAALCETWAITPSWQEAVPDGGTVFGVGDLAQWVTKKYGTRESGIYAQDYPKLMNDASQVKLAYKSRPEWRKLFPHALTDVNEARALLRYLMTRASGLSFLPRRWVAERFNGPLADEIVQLGVNILGHFAYPSGLRTSAESIVEGLRRNNIATNLRDVPVSMSSDETIGHNFKDLEVHDITLIHVQPEPLFLQARDVAGLVSREHDTYTIGYWYWEFDEVPASWNQAALSCDEIWTATEFVAQGLRKRFRQPVHVLTPGIEIAPFEQMSREDFGIKENEFVFLFVFHMVSIMDRKNPLAIIRAFKAAFPRNSRAKLIIKTSFGEKNPENLSILRKKAEGANIEIIDAIYSRDQTLSLMSASDAYVSLHRSEGLGLTMAEAMLLGRAVVATRYSGNLEFMNDDNSLLVDCHDVILERDIEPYKAGLQWAEPSVDHAARQMRRLYDDPDFAKRLGARAKADLEDRLSHKTTGEAMEKRLREIINLE